jgi:hypothetical protein
VAVKRAKETERRTAMKNIAKYHSLCEWYKKLIAIRRYTKKASCGKIGEVCQPKLSNEGGIQMDKESLTHTRSNCKYHIVFTPKYRRQVIYGQLLDLYNACDKLMLRGDLCK